MCILMFCPIEVMIPLSSVCVGFGDVVGFLLTALKSFDNSGRWILAFLASY